MSHRSPLSSGIIILLCSLFLAPVVAAANEADAQPRFAEGRILVMPAAGLASDKFEKLLRKVNRKAKKRRKLHRSRVHVIDVPPRMEKVIARFLARHPNIAFAELDEEVPPDAIVNDPSYSKQWHLPKMGAPSAWQLNDGQGVTVAVLDSGVDANHPDLAGQVLPGRNTVSNNSDTADINNHGTLVAGIIAARVNNATGGASVAPGAKILPIRITNNADGAAYFSDMAEGIMWAADNGARVANLSYGGAAGSASVANAANYMMSKGGVVMVSAGNDNTDYGYLNHPSLYVAGATTSQDTRADYSSYGGFVDITAPGSGIYTTARNGGYSTVNGTSFASPNTAAVAALIIAANPTLLPTDVMAVISNTAVDLGDPGWDPSYGYGRVDALAAVQLAAGVKTSDTTPPEATITSPDGGETLSETVAVTVKATDAFGVAQVDLLIDGQLIASETQTVGGNEYRFAWDSTTQRDGEYRISAQAFDEAGNMGESTEVSVEVVNTPLDEIAPTVTILSPRPNDSGSGNVALMATATDNEAVQQISISAAGQLRCAGTSSASCTWDLSDVAAGTYAITATAEDAAGNKGSSTVNFTVAVPVPEPKPEPEAPAPAPEPEVPAPAPEPKPVPEAPVPEPKPEPEAPAPAPEPEVPAPAPEPKPENPAPEPEPKPEPETPAPQPKPKPEPETPAPEPKPKPEPETPAPQPEPKPEPEPEAPAPEPEPMPEPEPEPEPKPEPETPAPEPEPMPEPETPAPVEPPTPNDPIDDAIRDDDNRNEQIRDRKRSEKRYRKSRESKRTERRYSKSRESKRTERRYSKSRDSSRTTRHNNKGYESPNLSKGYNMDRLSKMGRWYR